LFGAPQSFGVSQEIGHSKQVVHLGATGSSYLWYPQSFLPSGPISGWNVVPTRILRHPILRSAGQVKLGLCNSNWSWLLSLSHLSLVHLSSHRQMYYVIRDKCHHSACLVSSGTK
jgi:hypothetical protein